MTTPTIIPGSLEPSALIGYPVASFRFEERRSLTVHIEDPGWFDVSCDSDPNDECADAYPVFIGRYRSFDDARAITDRLNQAWRAFPQSTAREVAAFACRRLDFLINTDTPAPKTTPRADRDPSGGVSFFELAADIARSQQRVISLQDRADGRVISPRPVRPNIHD